MAVDETIMLGLALRFHVVIDGIDLGNWAKAEGLDVTWELAEYRAGDSANYRWFFPAATKFSNVKLTRAVSKESGKVMQWLSKVSFSSDQAKMIGHIQMLDATNKAPVSTWTLEGVMPVHYSGPQFDATASKVATETLEIAHLGFLDAMSGQYTK